MEFWAICPLSLGMKISEEMGGIEDLSVIMKNERVRSHIKTYMEAKNEMPIVRNRLLRAHQSNRDEQKPMETNPFETT
jgi:hypothetical protein